MYVLGLYISSAVKNKTLFINVVFVPSDNA
jgi:hypothetical protein